MSNETSVCDSRPETLKPFPVGSKPCEFRFCSDYSSNRVRCETPLSEPDNCCRLTTCSSDSSPSDPPEPEINDCYEIEGPAGSEESDHCDDDEHYFREEMIDDDEISIHSSMCLDVDGMADGRSAGGSGEQCSSGSSERLTLDSDILATTQTNLPLLCRPFCSSSPAIACYLLLL